MTTIAYKDGIMACDSSWSYNDGLSTLAKKIVRLRKSRALIGMSGNNDVRDLIALFDKIASPKTLPTQAELAAIKIDSAGIIVFPCRRVFKFVTTNKGIDHEDADDLGLWEIHLPLAVVGSGGDVALGAMAYGASPAKAVAIACRWDMASKLPVHQVRV